MTSINKNLYLCGHLERKRKVKKRNVKDSNVQEMSYCISFLPLLLMLVTSLKMDFKDVLLFWHDNLEKLM